MTDRKQQYFEAIDKLQEAKKILETIGRENQRDYDAANFSCQVGQILSSDNGQVGLIPMVERIQ